MGLLKTHPVKLARLGPNVSQLVVRRELNRRDLVSLINVNAAARAGWPPLNDRGGLLVADDAGNAIWRVSGTPVR